LGELCCQVGTISLLLEKMIQHLEAGKVEIEVGERAVWEGES
jgi:hypothetical protein